MEIVVVGGGPGGIMAAISAAKCGNKVILLEKEKSLGKKLLITGKGRCNITSSLDMREFINNVPGNGKFLFSCFQEFTNEDIILFLKKHGLGVKNERGNRVFPVTDSAKSVLDCFIKELKEQRVDVRTNCEVVDIKTENNKIVRCIPKKWRNSELFMCSFSYSVEKVILLLVQMGLDIN